MAGETPGAQKYSNQRRRLTHLDERSTDKFYRGDVSALGTTPGSVPPRETPPSTGRRKLAHLDERSTDKTYRAAGQSPTAQQLRWEEMKRTAPPRPGAQQRRPSPPPQGAHQMAGDSVAIHTTEDVRGAIDAVVSMLNNGVPEVLVQVADVKGLLGRARTRLETKVTQEIITEDQFRDVKFSKMIPGTGAQAPVDPGAQMPTRARAIAHTAPAEEGPPPVQPLDDPVDDPAAFLGGEGLAIQDNPLFATDEDGNDDIPPPAVAEGIEEQAMEQEAPEAGAQQEAGNEDLAARPRGRRRGRGT